MKKTQFLNTFQKVKSDKKPKAESRVKKSPTRAASKKEVSEIKHSKPKVSKTEDLKPVKSGRLRDWSGDLNINQPNYMKPIVQSKPLTQWDKEIDQWVKAR